MAPTEEVHATGDELGVDGVRIVFQNTPNTEAPAEMNFFFPDHGWLCMAENCSHNMHNLLPIRGAQARDALAWSKYINEAIELFGSDTDVLFASHHWPRWGRDDALGFLRRQRDLYRWMHDQTMRLVSHGHTALEIAELLELPAPLRAEGHTRGYYGTLVHNVKAVYQRYLGWYDANPAHLWPHPPAEAGQRYVELAGGADALLSNAQRAFDVGDYRWVVELVNHLIFADPSHQAARALQADAFEQLGYQSESATWRNSYLTGAKELRLGPPPGRDTRRRDMLAALTVDQSFDVIGVRLDVGALTEHRIIVNWRFEDLDEDWILGVENAAIHATPGRHDPLADASVTLAKRSLTAILAGSTTLDDAIADGSVSVDRLRRSARTPSSTTSTCSPRASPSSSPDDHDASRSGHPHPAARVAAVAAAAASTTKPSGTRFHAKTAARPTPTTRASRTTERPVVATWTATTEATIDSGSRVSRRAQVSESPMSAPRPKPPNMRMANTTVRNSTRPTHVIDECSLRPRTNQEPETRGARRQEHGQAGR